MTLCCGMVAMLFRDQESDVGKCGQMPITNVKRLPVFWAKGFCLCEEPYSRSFCIRHGAPSIKGFDCDTLQIQLRRKQQFISSRNRASRKAGKEETRRGVDQMLRDHLWLKILCSRRWNRTILDGLRWLPLTIPQFWYRQIDFTDDGAMTAEKSD